MDEKYERGQVVRVRSSQGVLTRVVVGDLGNVVNICRPEELKRAEVEHRDPAVVGFKKGDIVHD